MDEALLRAINAWSANEALAWIAIALSSRWMLLVVGFPLAIVQLRKKKWAVVLATALAIGASDQISSHVVKPIFDRERPCRALTGLEKPVSCGPGRSFPSTHASNAFAVVIAGGYGLRFAFAALIPIGILVSFSRVVLGVHYPSDVLAGAALGTLIGLGAMLILRRLEKKA